jgi:transcriptional regulator with XRE-family HTH domain
MAFVENLRRQRLEHYLSQAELARRAGVHALTITRLEAGTSAPSTRTVRALADALGVEPRELATPGEVAELRRVLGVKALIEDGNSGRLESESDAQGNATDNEH